MTTYISTWINVLVKQLTNEFKICLKRSRLIDTKDIIPYKKRTRGKLNTLEEVIKIIDKPITLEKAHIEQEALKYTCILKNYEISISEVNMREK